MSCLVSCLLPCLPLPCPLSCVLGPVSPVSCPLPCHILQQSSHANTTLTALKKKKVMTEEPSASVPRTLCQSSGVNSSQRGTHRKAIYITGSKKCKPLPPTYSSEPIEVRNLNPEQRKNKWRCSTQGDSCGRAFSAGARGTLAWCPAMIHTRRTRRFHTFCCWCPSNKPKTRAPMFQHVGHDGSRPRMSATSTNGMEVDLVPERIGSRPQPTWSLS